MRKMKKKYDRDKNYRMIHAFCCILRTNSERDYSLGCHKIQSNPRGKLGSNPRNSFKWLNRSDIKMGSLTGPVLNWSLL